MDEKWTKNGRKMDENPPEIRRKSDSDERKEWIIQQIKKRGKVKTKEIIDQFEIHKNTSIGDLTELLKEEKIIKKGRGRNIWYELNKEKQNG